MDEILKLLKDYSLMINKEMYLVFRHAGNGWVEDIEQVQNFEFKNLKDLKNKLTELTTILK